MVEEDMNRREAIKAAVLGLGSMAVMGSGAMLASCSGRKPKVVAINGSPRRDMNVAKLLEKAMEGAESQGAETEIFHLYGYKFKGCMSCFSCKKKVGNSNGKCVIHDSLAEVLKACREADALLFGAPIYYDNVCGTMRKFLERLMFPIDPYTVNQETGERERFLTKTVPVGFVYAMNAPENMRKDFYGPMFNSIEGYIRHIFGSCDAVYATNTYQFKDYNRYDVNLFREEDKRAWRDKQFPIDLQNAYDMGAGLIKKIQL